VPSSLVGASDAFALEHWWMGARTPTRYMSWEQVGELNAAGHEIGSHTRTHLNLSSIEGDAAALRDQIRGSKEEIEDRLGAPCRYIAWPFGRAQDIGETAIEEIVESGYAGCFSAIRGAASAGASCFRVPRHHFEADWPWPHVRYFALGKGGWLR